MKSLGQQIMELQSEIAFLKEELSEIKQKMRWQNEILHGAENNDFWMSVGQAGKYLRISEHTLRKRINRAEKERIEGGSPKLRRGIHYRHKGIEEAIRHTWEVNVKSWPVSQ